MVSAALCITLATDVWGQMRRRGANAPLQLLRQQLNKAGAAALDSNQETALQSAIATFRSTNRPAAPEPAEKAAREDYANSILAGNNDAAKTAADKLAGLMSARQQIRLEAEAAFAIQALSILHSDQVSALEASVGKEGLLRIVSSLIGPAGGFGRGMMGAGAMGSRRMGNPM